MDILLNFDIILSLVIQPLPWCLALDSINIHKIILKMVTCSTSRDLTKLQVVGWGWE